MQLPLASEKNAACQAKVFAETSVVDSLRL
jgi:hypothetical protein